MTCRFEVTSTKEEITPEGRDYQVTVSGDAYLPGAFQPYLKVWIDLPVPLDSPVTMERLKRVMTSKEFYTQIRQAFNPVTK